MAPNKTRRAAGSRSLARQLEPHTTDTAPPAPAPTPVIVGIGASAGGLEASRNFFDHMPADAPMAFVLVTHLAPEHSSMMVELLGSHTPMPVQEITDGMAVEARHVYVIPPDATLTILDGVLQLSRPAPPRQYRWPIDSFLVSLAEDQGDNAVAIVLSGSGSDGARGLRAVKEHGGLTLAQAGVDHVALSGMPASAAATGLVDHILPVEEMPERLLKHRSYLHDMREKQAPDGSRRDLAAHLQTICGLLRNHVGHDFSQYKEKTLVRRIQRRMQVAQADTVPAYIEHLRQNPRELDNLFRELLIGVTEFFRDPEAFHALQDLAIPTLLANKSGTDVLRVWVPACATGEEAYSVAIALAEAIDQRRGQGPKVQIFATDIDDRAIGMARSGRFRGALPGVSPQRLERWFTQDGDTYVVAKPIREMIVFSTHSAIKDPPFSRLDLITCRNLLIYLNAELQEHLIRNFHYALLPGGALMLGPSESLGRNGALFSELDKKHRLFLRRSDARNASPPAMPRRMPGVTLPSRDSVASGPAEDPLEQQARRLLERHSPASVVIDANHDVLRFTGDTGRYLGPSSGAASLNLFGLLHKGLRGPARTAVQQAISRNVPVTQEGLMQGPGGERIAVRMIAEPLGEPGNDGAPPRQNLCLIVFKELPPAPAEAPAIKWSVSQGGKDRVQELERELATTRDQLHTAIDELETANEEMKSANEEYQSVNEELQSSNEELETSKEEMQSINEELQTVNVELNSKNEALARLNSDLKNLLESTQIATLFLDSSLHVSGFTPAISDLFHLREGDHGRPITEITARIPYAELQQDVKQVLRTLAMVERTLDGGENGGVFLMRMRPYRTTDNVIEGVVLTFIDITERQQLEYDRARVVAIVESSQDAIIGHSVQGSVRSWNRGAEQIFGHAATRMIGRPLASLLPRAEQARFEALLAKSMHGPMDELEMDWLHQDGHVVPVSVRCSPVLDAHGAIIGGSTIVRDIGERRRGARRLAESARRLEDIITQTTVGVAQIDLDGRCGLVNPRFCQIVGRTAEELQGRPIHDLAHPDDLAEHQRQFRELLAGGAPFQLEARYVRPDGTTVWASSHVSLIQDDEGRPSSAVSVVLDTTQPRLANQQRELLLGELNHRVKNTLATVQAIATQSLKGAADLAEFRETFLSRLLALSNTHNLLSRDSWQGVDLRDLVDLELAPYVDASQATSRVQVRGTPLHLTPKTALALSLALHELATNAGKYGALSVATGEVTIEWTVHRVDERRSLELRWSERNGPRVDPPTRRGFGTRLLREGVAHELGGTIDLDFPLTGAVCTIQVPLQEPVTPDG